MTTIKKVGKEQALKIAKTASAEIIYDIIKLEGMPFTLQEVEAAIADCETTKQNKLNGKTQNRK